jgi:hypothetical protein
MLTGLIPTAIVEADCPYFFELRAIIGEQPNLLPVGVGNNDTPIDASVVLPGFNDDNDISSDYLELDFDGVIEVVGGEDNASEKDDHDKDSDEDLGEPEESLEKVNGLSFDDESDVNNDGMGKVPAKRKTNVSGKLPAEHIKKMKKTGPLPTKSTPAPKPVPSNLKKKSLVDRFADTSKAEEETVQKRIELKKEKVVAEKDMKVASVKAKAVIEMKKHELKSKYALEKMRLEHEFHLVELHAWNNMGFGASSHGLGMSSQGSSLAGSHLNTPFDFGELDLPKTSVTLGFQFHE